MLELIHAWSDERQSHIAGFTIVHQSTGMSTRTARTLAHLSGIDLSTTGTVAPVHAHRVMQLDGQLCSVISSITQTPGPAPDRPGRVAHHIVLTPSERPEIGPVALALSDRLVTQWDPGSTHNEVPPAVPDHAEYPPDPEIDSEWIRLLTRRVHAHATTSALVPSSVRCIDLAAAIERATPASQQWELTFLTETDRMRVGVLLLAASAERPSGARIVEGKDGVVLSLSKSPPTREQSHEQFVPEPTAQDRVELAPASMEQEAARMTGPVILLVALAAGAIALVAAVLSGWSP
jgi:hypothetical protein